jgi:hypothetical protein
MPAIAPTTAARLRGAAQMCREELGAERVQSALPSELLDDPLGHRFGDDARQHAGSEQRAGRGELQQPAAGPQRAVPHEHDEGGD